MHKLIQLIENFAITALSRMISFMFVAPRILLKKVTTHLESSFLNLIYITQSFKLQLLKIIIP